MRVKFLLILAFLSSITFTSCSKNSILTDNKEKSNTEPTVEEKAKIPEIVDISFSAIGDILIHEPAFNSMKNGDSFDFHPMFEDIAPFVNSSDFTIANLETTLAGKDKGYSGYPTFNSPEQLAYSLKNTLGVDLVSTSNNHSLDKGINGLNQTIDFLNEYKLDHIGTAKSQEERDAPYIKNIKGVNIGFISYTYGTNGIPIPKGKEYAVNLIDREKIKKDCETLEKNGAEFIISLLHWGNEYEKSASTEQKELAKWIFENTNSSLIIGNHAHVVQPIEEITVMKDGKEKKGVVAYALGNFTGNQKKDFTDSGIILNVDISINKDDLFSNNTIKKVSYTPTYIDKNSFSTGKGNRTINVLKAIEDYENGKDSLITKDEYTKMKKYKDSYNSLIKENNIILAENY